MGGGKTLAILYSSGGLGDVGRHAVRAALDLGSDVVSKIVVLSKDPEVTLLKEPRWNCGCPENHDEYTAEELLRMDIRAVDVSMDDLTPHLELDDGDGHKRAVDAVVSCLGTRQPFWGDRVGTSGNTNLLSSMSKLNVNRLVAMSSMGIEEDWPPAEFHWGGRAMAAIFMTIGRREFQDLTGIDRAVRKHADSHEGFSYLLVRPAGLGEDVVPRNEWAVQKEKGNDPLDVNLAKLDCARFMVQEALSETPQYPQKAVVVGGKLDGRA